MGFMLAVTCATVLGLSVLGLLGFLFLDLLRKNRLLALTIGAALGLHLAAFALALLMHGPVAAPVTSAVLHIATPPPPLPTALPQVPKPVITPLAVPQGVMTGQRTAKVNPRGDHPGRTPGASGPVATTTCSISAPPLTQPTLDPDAASYPDNGSLDPREIATIATSHRPGSGTRGEHGGFKDGDRHSRVYRRGDPHGKIDGRVYFIRLKHSSGAWNAHAEGIRRLLRFLDPFIVCESDSWPMTAEELAERYLRHDMQPCFLYLYCDETFRLSASEVTILRGYLARGGFLFLDSRPDPFIKDLVAAQLAPLLPGARLAPLAKSHPINRFLFQLSAPGVGFNIVDRTNYGMTRGDRLAVFYTMGNFAQLYASNTPESDDYITAQYQMGANVLLYAIEKGNATGIKTQAGANARITTQTLNRLLEVGSAPSAVRDDAPRAPLKLTAPDAETPADIILPEE